MSVADLIAGIVQRHENPWPLHERECILASAEDRPAYWTKTDGTDLVTSNVASFATRANDLQSALEFYSKDPDVHLYVLENLIPLNHEACMQIRNSYAARKQWPRLGRLYDRRFY